MIAGRPPFNGENHIDLLRNIQRKAVRLPPTVRVSKACVNLLRLLLNRNPLSRAGFNEFFEACDSFVALGCGGVATGDNEGGVGRNRGGSTIGSGSNRIVTTTKDLGTIHENDHGGTNNPSSDSLMTIATTAEQQQQQHVPVPQKSDQGQAETGNIGVNTNLTAMQPVQQPQQQQAESQNNNAVSPNVTPLATPPGHPALIPNSINMYSNANAPRSLTSYQAPNNRNRLAPLTSSPPSSLRPIFYPNPHSRPPPPLPLQTGASINSQHHNPYQQQQMQQQQTSVGCYTPSVTGMVQANTVSQSQASVSDDSGFVMVEHTKSPNSSQHYYATSSQQYRSNNVNNDVAENPRTSKGMLSTSPGTGKLLLGMMGRATIGFGVGGGNNDNGSAAPLSPNANKQKVEQSTRMAKLANEIAAANKMIATAEDVGRRAVSVAHLGDSRAYLGMRLLFKMNEEGSSLLSSTPMEGMEEEPGSKESNSGNGAVNTHVLSNENSSSDIMTSTRRRPSTSGSADKQMMADDCVEDDMPFAISPDTPSVSLPSRSDPSGYQRSTSSFGLKKSSAINASPENIRFRFGEALSCYLKSLKMLKGAVGAAQRVAKDLKDVEDQIGKHNDYRSRTDNDLTKMKHRSEITTNWLCSQFRGVLERADAANAEISKLTASGTNNTGSTGNKEENKMTNTVSIEELIYNHALASGRDGAVKQLLGQYEAARSCYRSAGLLAETLLMEVNIGTEDRKILEGYVDGFAARITELDQLMLQQSRMAISSNTTPSQSQQSRRGSGIVGLIGPPSSAPETSSPFVVGSPR